MEVNEQDNDASERPSSNRASHYQDFNIERNQNTAIAVGEGATAVYHGLSVEQVATLVVELKRQDQPDVWDGRIPYMGLTSFRESDAQFFFGRESLVDDLLARVESSNFITIAGPSGSGKSSVARAGLFHALRNNGLPHSDRWLLADMQPKGDPIEQLAASIDRLMKRPGAGDYIREKGLDNPLSLHEQVETLLEDDPRQRFVLLVDQFEETFTQTKDKAEREAFIELLTRSVGVENGRLTIILCLRSDFVSQCVSFPNLRTLMSNQIQLVGAMEPHELTKAITLPALEVGAEIDPRLVKQIMDDMRGEPGALPLMSFALRDLFEAEKTSKGQPMDMTLPEYVNRGGIESALERHANKVFATFTAEQQTLAENIFSKLIEIGQGRVDTRRTATFAELVPSGVEETAVIEVVRQLAREDVRLVTTDGAQSKTTVTIAHERMIDAWPWLRNLVDRKRETIRVTNEIIHDAQRWTTKRDVGFLYRGGRLLQIEEELGQLAPALDELSARFIRASLDQRKMELDLAQEQQNRELEQLKRIARGRQVRLYLSLFTILILFILLFSLLAPIIQRENARRSARGDLIFIGESVNYSLGIDNANPANGELPVQTVNIPAFNIEKYEVTNRRYNDCVEFGGCSLPGDLSRFQDETFAEHPVSGITAIEAAAFCHWIRRELPNELQWERAARGPESWKWPWDDDAIRSEYAIIGPDFGTTRPVGSRPEGKSYEHLYDLVGNVWEWTSSYESNKYDPDNLWSGDWQELNPQSALIVRGLGFSDSIELAAVTWRRPLIPTTETDDIGFRCAEN